MSEVADRYRVGRTFLVGDAAHRLPPTGGLGLNTGLQDAHNLAWKIAAVEQGRASDTLPDRYHTERHAVALKSEGADDAKALQRWLSDPAVQADIQRQVANQREHFDGLALQLGFVYGPEGYDYPDVSDFQPRLVGGGRMTHAWLERDGEVVPLLDLLDDQRFILLVGSSYADMQGGAAPTMNRFRTTRQCSCARPRH